MARKSSKKNPPKDIAGIGPSDWIQPGELPLHLAQRKVFSLDVETYDPRLKELGPSWFRSDQGWLAGIALGWEGGKVYLPIHHACENLDEGMVLGWLGDLLKNYDGTLVMHNCMYDLGWLRVAGIKPGANVKLWDTMFTESLLDEYKQGQYNLNALARYYKLKEKDEVQLNAMAEEYGLDPKGELAKLPAGYVAGYAERDAELTMEVYAKQVPLMEPMMKVHELEHMLVPMLLDMKFKGVRVDVDKAVQTRDLLRGETQQYVEEIKKLTGRETVDIWAAESCARALEAASIHYNTTATGKPSITDEWCATFPEGSVPQLINKARKSDKAGNNFCQGMILDHADHTGRIHCDFNPLKSDEGGTVSGRFSSSNPNLQQVPVREARMNTMIRGLFLPEEGAMWCAADYSQQEPRLTVHYAASKGFSGGEEAAEAYRSNPDTDYHNFTATLMFGANFTPEQRKRAKIINLGLAYGMGGGKLARKLGLPTSTWKAPSGMEVEVAGPEAKALLDQYHKSLPFIKQLSNHYMEIAAKYGEIKTITNRRCRFNMWQKKGGGRALNYEAAVKEWGEPNIERAFTYRALNRLIQGGSADMMKVAMRNLYNEGIVPHLTIHDEIGASVADKAEARRIAEIMRDCVGIRVPLKVDIDFGKTWGEAKPITEDEEDDVGEAA